MKKTREVKILVRLSDNENKRVEIYKSLNNLKTKEEAIKQMIRNTPISLSKGLKSGL